MGRLVLILGGARSGKSAFAELLAKGHRRVAYIATAEVLDDEMRRRVQEHRRRRPRTWVTYEAARELPSVLRRAARAASLIIVDCMTIYLSNLMAAAPGGSRKGGNILAHVKEVCGVCKRIGATVILVSNEVGMGIVPETPLGREFRDLQGWANQLIAASADEVYLVTAGIPQRIK